MKPGPPAIPPAAPPVPTPAKYWLYENQSSKFRLKVIFSRNALVPYIQYIALLKSFKGGYTWRLPPDRDVLKLFPVAPVSRRLVLEVELQLA